MERQTSKRFTLAISDEMLTELNRVAARSPFSAAGLARFAIAQFLRNPSIPLSIEDDDGWHVPSRKRAGVA